MFYYLMYNLLQVHFRQLRHNDQLNP